MVFGKFREQALLKKFKKELSLLPASNASNSKTITSIAILTDNVMFENIDTVTLYLNPKRQEEYYDYILKLNPRRVIFNPGTENFEFSKMLKEKGIKAEIACTLVLLSTNQY